MEKTRIVVYNLLTALRLYLLLFIMPATIDWLPPYPNVLLMKIEGHVTMGEALDVTEQESHFMANAAQKIHTIIDLSLSEGVPLNFVSSMPRIARMPAASHPNAGQKIVVGASGIASTVLSIFSKMYRNLHMVDTLADAYAILDEVPPPPNSPHEVE